MGHHVHTYDYTHKYPHAHTHAHTQAHVHTKARTCLMFRPLSALTGRGTYFQEQSAWPSRPSSPRPHDQTYWGNDWLGWLVGVVVRRCGEGRAVGRSGTRLG